MMNNSYFIQGYFVSIFIMMLNIMVVVVYFQLIVLVLFLVGVWVLFVFCLMLVSGMLQVGISFFYVQSFMMGQNGMLFEGGDQLIYVVGFQGCRGIFFSVLGWFVVFVFGIIVKNLIFQKDVDGKFFCFYCIKIYFYVKYLKCYLFRCKLI